MLDVPEGLVGSVLLVLRSLWGCWGEAVGSRHCGGDVPLCPLDVPLCCWLLWDSGLLLPPRGSASCWRERSPPWGPASPGASRTNGAWVQHLSGGTWSQGSDSI